MDTNKSADTEIEKPKRDPRLTVEIYLDDGRVYTYMVPNAYKAREHAQSIIKMGYRHVEHGYMEHYPPHRITKIKCTGDIDTMYPDTVRGT